MSDPLGNAPYVKGLLASANLGAARGSIQIDTRDLRNVQATARGVGQDVERSLGKVDTSAKRLQTTFAAVGRGIKSMQGELVALGATGAILTGLGLRVAGSFEEAQIQLTGLVGTQEKARALMDDIRKRAAQAGLPFSDMLAVATRLLPTLQGNTEELGKWYDLARRVAVLNRQEGVAGAAFSINEAISSGGTDLVSLAERFNISRFAVREALTQTGGDFAAALDIVLTKMGITQQTADQMGQTFNASLRAARDAASQLVAEGLTPVLTTMTPILQASAQWLAQMRETNPEIGAMAAGMLVFSATLPPALLLLNQMIEAMQKLKTMGVLGALGRAGMIATPIIGAGIGMIGGIAAVRGIGQAAGATGIGSAADAAHLSNYSQDQFWADAKRMLASVMFDLITWASGVRNAMSDAVGGFVNGIAAMMDAMGRWVGSIGGVLPERMGGSILTDQARHFQSGADLMRQQASGFADLIRSANARQYQELADFVRLSIEPTARSTVGSRTGIGANIRETPTAMQRQYSEAEQKAAQERTDIIVQWATSVRALERETADARLQATQQYEAQRTSVIESYERTIARDAEDFARQRARQQAELERRIMDILRDAAERRAEWQAELDERIAEIRDDGNERLAEIEEDYQRNRERAERSHRETLLGAAGRLDAAAVAAEQRRYAQAQADAEQAHQERVADEQESIDERIAQEQEAHQERLEAAREADERRIADMRRAIAEQQRMEDEDRAIRLARMAEDHDRQLRELDETHRERIAQINRQAATERQMLDEHLQAQLQQLGEANAAWLQAQWEKEKDAMWLFDLFWENIKRRIWGGPMEGLPETPPPRPIQYAEGGPVPRTEMALVHAGEYVLNPQTTAAMRSMMGGFNQRSLLNAVAGGGARSVTVEAGAIQVYGAAGMDEARLAAMVERRVVEVLEQAI